jgi:predicted thioesterase
MTTLTPVAGRTATARRTVEERDCATQWGNDGLHVLSTPAILGTMEQLCVQLLAPTLHAGQMTVGVRAELHHRAPTPLGAAVAYTVTVTEAARRIRIAFTVTDDAGTVVCTGTHDRAVIEVAAFQAALANSGGGS